jgi:putative ATP-dependent endonuclease of OLD family
MRLRRLEIKNYRGIRDLTWVLDARFACLVGPGDSTKTTILDAIGCVLSSRYNLSFTDADFYRCDTSNPIEITAAVTELPDKLIRESSHGMNRSGIHADGSLEHDPISDADECLLVRLIVDQSLEPVWEVIRPGDDDGGRITASERALLGFFRIGDYADTHLRWGRGSALTGVTNSKTDAVHAVVEAQRQARKAVAELADTPLHDAALLAQTEAIRLGSAPYRDLRPGLDPRISSGSGSLVLHEGDVPLTNYGLGSRRLTSLAIQDLALEGRSMIAIDEVEHGLDPHRLLHLVRYLRSRAGNDDLQVFVTTHAPLAIEALSPDELFVVRSTSGRTTVEPVPDELIPADADTVQGVMRARPSALLARRLIVGEGNTETGFLRQLLWSWDAERADPEQLTAVTAGVAVVNGGGDSQAPKRARSLACLGYPTSLVVDGDASSNATAIQAALTAGVEVFQWRAPHALEQVVALALPVVGLQAMLEMVAAEVSNQTILLQMALGLSVPALDHIDVAAWIAAHDANRVRSAVGVVARTHGWFKREDRGERLAQLVMEHRAALDGSELATGIEKIRAFAYREANAAEPEPEEPDVRGVDR